MDKVMTIPKIIHYCWFGGNPLPESALRCIQSWEKYCPDFEIKRWDESNFDINCCDYVREAYDAKKWAFVSDYARFDILYHYGGLYFDTDVELVASIDDLLERGPFLGMEQNTDGLALVNPGLGMVAMAGMLLYERMLEDYQKMHFVKEDGSFNQTTIVRYTTDLLIQNGLQNVQEPQQVTGVWVYPWDYFCPVMYQTEEVTFTPNTRAIHHYSASWLTQKERQIHQFEAAMCRRFGMTTGHRIAWWYALPYKIKKKAVKLAEKVRKLGRSRS